MTARPLPGEQPNDTAPDIPVLRNLHAWILAQVQPAAPVTVAIRSDLSGWSCSCGAGMSMLGATRTAVRQAASEHAERCGTEPAPESSRGTAQVLTAVVVCLLAAGGLSAVLKDWLLTSGMLVALGTIVIGVAGRWSR